MPMLSLLLLAAAASAPLQPATRAEVAVQRAAIEQRFEREMQDCQDRFAVTPCMDKLRRERQQALVPLVRRDHELDAEERRERAAAQARRARERELSAAQDEGERRERLVAAPAPQPPALPASHGVRARDPAVVARNQLQAQQDAQAAAAARRERAQQRQERARQRIVERQAREKSRLKAPAAPLPLPGASAASAAR